ncbi:MAG: PfkB family carbohydrate kinase [Chloroflexi bacterium]|nr:PfkB family carbohydrate kinase [Chloroflexota bacterium]
MSVVIVGTVGIDDIVAPAGRATRVLGGSGTYAALAARLFAPTALVSVVGTDFPEAHRQLLEGRGVDLTGLDVVEGETFRWGGRYHEDLNTRDTEFVELNVVTEFTPRIPATNADYIFVGNIEPGIQQSVMEQLDSAAYVATDSMDHWIRGQSAELAEVFRRSTLVVLNDQEARMFSRESRVPKAVGPILALGPQAVVVKLGEYGAVLAHGGEWFSAPGYPLPEVVDPTGAGDAFAGAMLGSLAEARAFGGGRGSDGGMDSHLRGNDGGEDPSPQPSPARGEGDGPDAPHPSPPPARGRGHADPHPNPPRARGRGHEDLRRAIVYGSVAASFTVEAFGVERLAAVTREDVEARYAEFKELVAF